MKNQIVVNKDSLTGQYYIVLPEDVLNRSRLKEGDKLEASIFHTNGFLFPVLHLYCLDNV